MAATIADLSPSDIVRRSIASGRRADIGGLVFQAVLLCSLLLALLVVVVLVADVLRGAIGLLSERGADFLTSNLSSRADRAGVWQGIRGSLVIGLFVIALSLPLGIAAAVYLEEYAGNNRVTRFIDLNIRNLAGVPSVVYGLLGLSFFVQTLGGLTGGTSVISAGLTLAILVLPIVIITSAEALRAVPTSIREAGFGVGATRWEVIRSHVLPFAAPGILTGTVLSISRALGEAAPLILVGAITGFFVRAGGGGLLESLQGQFTALPMIVYGWARQPRADFRELTSAAIVVLLAVVLFANATAILLRNHYDKKR